MFLRESYNKNYSVIIIPDKGSNTRTIKFSTRLFQIAMAVFFTLLICISFLIIYCFFQRNNISILHKKEMYIEALEKANKANSEKINTYNREIINYNKDGNIVKNKLKEVQKLEDSIKNKINKSIFLKNISYNNTSYVNVAINNKALIDDIENNIVKLNDLNKKMDMILVEEQFIPSVLPCLGLISSYFGYRKNPFNEIQSDFHPGIDIICAYGTKIFAAASGTVTNASYNAGYGNEVVIDHHNEIQTIYGHNSKLYVHVGQIVKKGDLIALSGSTGKSTGPHLHFEIRKNRTAIDPNVFFLKGEEKNMASLQCHIFY